MNIIIQETGEDKTLSIIDRKSGVNWVGDLMGNYDAKPEYHEEKSAYIMPEAEFIWWHDLTAALQSADDRYQEIKSIHPNPWKMEDLAMYYLDNDLETQPMVLESFCDFVDGRLEAARDLMQDCPEDTEEAHEAIADAMINLDPLKDILTMRELDGLPETYVWIKNRLECE